MRWSTSWAFLAREHNAPLGEKQLRQYPYQDGLEGGGRGEEKREGKGEERRGAEGRKGGRERKERR